VKHDPLLGSLKTKERQAGQRLLPSSLWRTGAAEPWGGSVPRLGTAAVASWPWTHALRVHTCVRVQSKAKPGEPWGLVPPPLGPGCKAHAPWEEGWDLCCGCHRLARQEGFFPLQTPLLDLGRFLFKA